MVGRKCYIAMLEMNDHLQTISIEEQRMVTNPVKGLEEILLDNFKPEQMTRIGNLANSSVRQVLTIFLKENQDIFAWSHEDMPGIDLSVMLHKLNMSPSFPSTCQKKRVFALKRDRAIEEEVHRLQDA